jgi:hypothetical protein
MQAKAEDLLTGLRRVTKSCIHMVNIDGAHLFIAP